MLPFVRSVSREYFDFDLVTIETNLSVKKLNRSGQRRFQALTLLGCSLSGHPGRTVKGYALPESIVRNGTESLYRHGGRGHR
jgi:hypothetical protein